MVQNVWVSVASYAMLFLTPLSVLFGSSLAIAVVERAASVAVSAPTLSVVPAVIYATFPIAADLMPAATTTEEIIPERNEPDVIEEKPEPLPEPVPVKRPVSPSFTTPQVALTDAEKKSLLSIHNRERRSLDIPALSWSPALAVSAQAWSDTSAARGCVLAHSYVPNVGEVVYYSQRTGVDLSLRTPSEVMGEFLKEKTYYNADTGECDPGKVCGHYTQIVWADTTEVGCGKSACSAPGEYEEIWTCHYAPIGNIEGQLPYYP